jgi:hypothetical protein
MTAALPATARPPLPVARSRSRWWRRPGATQGEWWRFSLYEIRDGCIRPAKGAKLEWYDPWPDFQDTRTQTVGQAPAAVQPGYQSLLNLVHQLKYLPGQSSCPKCLTQESQALILEWCRQHGLLGVLHSRWEEISLASQQDAAGNWSQRRYSRGFGQVIQDQLLEGDVEDRTAYKPRLAGSTYESVKHARKPSGQVGTLGTRQRLLRCKASRLLGPTKRTRDKVEP